jgi:type IV pilus assembly protein PilO
MRGRDEIWRLRLWVWVPALVFFLANATAYVVYRFGFADRVESLRASLEETQKQLAPLDNKQTHFERLIQRSQRNEVEIRRLYEERFSTRSQRLTRITAEVKRLARSAGLDPRSITYPELPIEEYGLIKRSFTFPVSGTYLELRKFINLLELSDSFLSLDEVTLAGDETGEGPELDIRLSLSTLFAKEAGDAETAPPEVPATPAAPAAQSPAAPASVRGES